MEIQNTRQGKTLGVFGTNAKLYVWAKGNPNNPTMEKEKNTETMIN